MNPRARLARWDELPLEKVTDMVARKAVAAPGATLTQTYLKKGAIVPRHAHPRDVVIYVLQGALRTEVDGAELTVREGGVLAVEAGAIHQAESLDDTFVLTFA
ncbi:MAG TPA: cupin domain-containing protein [Vicinamibacterales bacterium]|jgi:quercetin dioxygenase-like cupin family protein|nr:cupin domain-containing protein [Vicinamibacterales bacterium]